MTFREHPRLRCGIGHICRSNTASAGGRNSELDHANIIMGEEIQHITDKNVPLSAFCRHQHWPLLGMPNTGFCGALLITCRNILYPMLKAQELQLV